MARAAPYCPTMATMKTGRPTVLTGDWEALVEAAGGVGDLADELGVHRVTIRRWAKGELPVSRSVELAIRSVAGRLGVRSPV
jgi:hypothetical protein